MLYLIQPAKRYIIKNAESWRHTLIFALDEINIASIKPIGLQKLFF